MTTHSDLYSRICSFALTAPDANISFEEKLADENGWTHGFATLVTSEYRKFIYLTQVAEQPVCPSEEVDKAWHLHITQTLSYKTFCTTVLSGFLHHHASRGGAAELQHHQTMYAFTLQKYRDVFGANPNPALWPSAKERFARHLPSQSESEPVRERDVFTEYPATSFLCMVLLGMVASLFIGDLIWNPIAPAYFLGGFLLLFVFISWVPCLFSRNPFVPWKKRTLDAYEIAFLNGGADRVWDTALVSLIGHGALLLSTVQSAAKGDTTSSSCSLNPAFDMAQCAGLHPIETRILRAWPANNAVAQAIPAVLPAIEEIQLRLAQAGYATGTKNITRLRSLTVLLLQLLAFVGGSRLFFGLHHQHPVSFL